MTRGRQKENARSGPAIAEPFKNRTTVVMNIVLHRRWVAASHGEFRIG